MHWSLFIFFNNDNGRTQIIDLFNQDKYVSDSIYTVYFIVSLDISSLDKQKQESNKNKYRIEI